MESFWEWLEYETVCPKVHKYDQCYILCNHLNEEVEKNERKTSITNDNTYCDPFLKFYVARFHNS